jgi:hypothetical protein
MQTLTGQRPTNSLSSQSRTVAVLAILLFAFAGLISGFAIGAFVRPNQSQQSNKTTTVINPPTQGKTQSPTPTTRTLPELLGEPVIDQVQYSQEANGTTTYNFAAHAIYKNGQAVRKDGITCKIWLTHDGNVNRNMPTSRLRAIGILDQPFPKEDANTLIFDSTTSQTQPCAAGVGNWNYKLSSSLKSGTYYLVILMDWEGAHYNWKWVQVTVTK